MTPLEKAVELVGGQAALANAIGVKQAHIWNWLNVNRRSPPAEYVIAIERATGGRVTRHDLRPDIYPLDENSRKATA